MDSETFNRARMAFDIINMAAYNDSAFREILVRDPDALAAAEKLAERVGTLLVEDPAEAERTRRTRR